MRNILTAALLLLTTSVQAQYITFEVTEEDASPSVFLPYQLRFSNGSVTNNNDGTVSINTSGTNVSGWTDDGTNIRLTTPTDNVGIGITTTEAKVAVNETFSHSTGTKAGYTSLMYHNASSSTDDLTAGMNFIVGSQGANAHSQILGINGLVQHEGTNTLGIGQGGSFLVKNTSSGTMSTAYGGNYAFSISGSGNITNGIGIQIAAPTYTSTGRITGLSTGAYIFNQGNSSTANSTAIYILDQSGSSGLNGAIYAEGGLTYLNANKTAAGDLIVSGDNETNLLFVDASSDNVGIGTSGTLGSRLEVFKNDSTAAASHTIARFYNSSLAADSNLDMRLGQENTTGKSVIMRYREQSSGDTGDFGIFFGGDSFGTTGVTWKQGGNIGIGTSAPISILTVDKGTGVGQFTLDGSTGGCLMMRDTDDAGWTECDFLNGVMTCSIDADGLCD